MSVWVRAEAARYRAYAWSREAGLATKVLLALGGAAAIGLAAQVRFHLPWTPVPVTGQTLAVLLVGVLLGRHWGGVSTGLYLTLGAAGLPWFAGFKAGWGALAGPTGGYLVGFVLAALFLGHVTDRFAQARSFWALLGLMLLANFALIHGPGLAWLAVVTGTHDPVRLLWMGTVPFVYGDVFKALVAAGLACAATPKRGTW